jgi:phosphohistidine phosphatase
MATRRELFILRHAKSSWDDAGLEDHERPLSARGQRAARALSDHIRDTDIRPDLVLCSASRRTRETVDLVDPPGRRIMESGLYGASAQDVLERLRRLEDEVRAAMVVGHNPAMQTLVLRLAAVPVAGAVPVGGAVPVAGAGTPASEGGSGRAPILGGGTSGPYEQIVRKFPTGALATLVFEGEWHELGPGRARLVGFVRPKSLGA